MSVELVVGLLLALIIIGAAVKRLIWLAIIALFAVVLMQLGVFDALFEFVRETLIQNPPIQITIG